MGWGCLGTDVLLPHLGFYLVPAQLPLPLLPLRGSAPLMGASACLTPVCWSQVIGCLSFCFPGDVGWASALPFFSGLLLLRLLAGVVGFLHPVSGCSC